MNGRRIAGETMPKKSIILTGDWHCGGRTGLTMPQYQYRDGPGSAFGYYALIQSAVWDWFSADIDAIRERHGIDMLIINGDAIDGSGAKNGGGEMITTDRNIQVEMAENVARFIDAKKCLVTAGTPYHTGQEEDFESVLASNLNADFGSHEFVNVNGLIIDCKHKVGSSAIPHGRHTAIAREALWNLLWNEKGVQPRADVIIRSHVHYHGYCGDSNTLRMTLPAMQLWTKYGGRQCSGTIDLGFVHMIVDEHDGDNKPSYSWQAHLLDLKVFRQECIIA